MLQLNIKSSSYMCLDINPDSVIHSQLEAKIYNLTSYMGGRLDNNYIISKEVPDRDPQYHSTHNLTMLPSFHISLGAPPPNSEIKTESVELQKHEFHELIGMMSLADINISKNKDKKSAWISINDVKFSLATRIIPFSYMHSEDLHLHISLANLTGNPHDSIARPEDCIIDTITA